MGSVIWSEDYSLGVDGLDSDHILAVGLRYKPLLADKSR